MTQLSFIMVRLLHERPEFSDRFIGHMLARNISN